MVKNEKTQYEMVFGDKKTTFVNIEVPIEWYEEFLKFYNDELNKGEVELTVEQALGYLTIEGLRVFKKLEDIQFRTMYISIMGAK
jgi:hypothetical protein